MPVAALVEAASFFGIPENNLRVALARLVASGCVTRDERGRYRLGPAAFPVSHRIADWRHPERAVRPWNGAWVGILFQPARSGAARRARERVCRLYGFRRLRASLAVRPDNLRAPLEELRQRFGALGLPPGDLVVSLRGLDPETDARARALWDTEGLRRHHRALLARLERSERRFPSLAPREAMVESFLLGGEAIRSLVLDPLLPEEICPARERDALAAAMRRYDELGRSAWAEFLARFDVPHHRNPIHGCSASEAVGIG